MTPLRALIHLQMMCKTASVTLANLEGMVDDYRQRAAADDDFDIEWYMIKLAEEINTLQAAGWTVVQIKAQIGGRLTNLIPINSFQ